MSDIQNWLATQPKGVQKNVTVLGQEQAGAMYRIDKVVPKTFVPRMPTSALSDENNSVPRVCVAPSLLGCIFGYNINRLFMDFQDGIMNVEPFDEYRGGFRISVLDYGHCVKPNNSLVRDASITDEHWLVAYNKETAQYKPVSGGLFFVEDVRLNVNQKDRYKRPDMHFTFLLKITHDDGVVFDKNHHLEKGSWRVTLGQIPNEKKMYVYECFDGAYEVGVTKISDSEFDEKKKTHCAMLSNVKPPFYCTW